MPWKDTGPVEESKNLIEDWLAGGRRNVAGLSRAGRFAQEVERLIGSCQCVTHQF